MLNFLDERPINAIEGYRATLRSAAEKAGVTVVWHYNAFLSHTVEPVEEERVWLDVDIANQTQVDVNAYLLHNGLQPESEYMEQLKLAESLYANACALWEEEAEGKETTLDRRA